MKSKTRKAATAVGKCERCKSPKPGELPQCIFEVPGAFVAHTYKLRTSPPPAPITEIELEDGESRVVLDGHRTFDYVAGFVRGIRYGYLRGLKDGAEDARRALRTALGMER